MWHWTAFAILSMFVCVWFFQNYNIAFQLSARHQLTLLSDKVADLWKQPPPRDHQATLSRESGVSINQPHKQTKSMWIYKTPNSQIQSGACFPRHNHIQEHNRRKISTRFYFNLKAHQPDWTAILTNYFVNRLVSTLSNTSLTTSFLVTLSCNLICVAGKVHQLNREHYSIWLESS